jgi:hypothetical protein
VRTTGFVEWADSAADRYAQEKGVLRGASFETDDASLLAWRDWGFPARSACSMFSPPLHWKQRMVPS